VQEQCREGNDERQECQPATVLSRACSSTPPIRGRSCDNNRHADEGVNADGEAPPLFMWASQNLAVAAMLLRDCPEPATSDERRVRQQLKALLETAVAQQAESSASHQRSARGAGAAPSVHR
jgi:hypothetical protein